MKDENFVEIQRLSCSDTRELQKILKDCRIVDIQRQSTVEARVVNGELEGFTDQLYLQLENKNKQQFVLRILPAKESFWINPEAEVKRIHREHLFFNEQAKKVFDKSELTEDFLRLDLAKYENSSMYETFNTIDDNDCVVEKVEVTVKEL